MYDTQNMYNSMYQTALPSATLIVSFEVLTTWKSMPYLWVESKENSCCDRYYSFIMDWFCPTNIEKATFHFVKPKTYYLATFVEI